MPKKPKSTHYIATERWKWFEYVEEDATDDDNPIRVEVRQSLTFGELEDLVWDPAEVTKDSDLWPMFAPFVRAWNFATLDPETGEEVEIPAPAVGGPDQFQYIPPQLFLTLVRDLRFRSSGPLARKSSVKLVSTDAGTSGGA